LIISKKFPSNILTMNFTIGVDIANISIRRDAAVRFLHELDHIVLVTNQALWQNQRQDQYHSKKYHAISEL
jgi:hypothetical protein